MSGRTTPQCDLPLPFAPSSFRGGWVAERWRAQLAISFMETGAGECQATALRDEAGGHLCGAPRRRRRPCLRARRAALTRRLP
jgi:hypothetical protein